MSLPKYTKNYFRVSKFTIEEVRMLWEAANEISENTGKKTYFKMCDVRFNMNSDRYDNLFINGTDCVNCGIKGEYFILECGKKKNGTPNNQYHFNLYGIDKNGNEVMMTKDHIRPKSKGGKNHVSNYQCMCERCNHKKADKYEEG